jgi:hypothetical protein
MNTVGFTSTLASRSATSTISRSLLAPTPLTNGLRKMTRRAWRSNIQLRDKADGPSLT